MRRREGAWRWCVSYYHDNIGLFVWKLDQDVPRNGKASGGGRLRTSYLLVAGLLDYVYTYIRLYGEVKQRLQNTKSAGPHIYINSTLYYIPLISNGLFITQPAAVCLPWWQV